MSDSEDLTSFAELSLDPPEIPCEDSQNLNEDDVLKSLTEFESAQAEQNLSCIVIQASDSTQTVNAVKGVENEIPHVIEWDKLNINKCLSKCATFPLSARIKCPNDTLDGIEEHKSDKTVEDLTEKGSTQFGNPPWSRSVSLPTPLKLVSAMKGSREKLGAPPRNLTVTWAPDVYDPLPTAVSHVPNQKPQRYRNDKKRNGKNKQKGGGKSSRSKGKEKKQSRKSGGSSNKPFKFVDNESSGHWSGGPQGSALGFAVGCPDPFCDSQRSEALSGGPQASTLDFGVSSHDPFCGHSFLKNSVTSIHFPVTEAT